MLASPPPPFARSHDNGAQPLPDSAPWRPESRDPDALARLAALQEEEERLFQDLLAHADNADTSLGRLFELALALSPPPGQDTRALAEELAQNVLTRNRDFDADGNPLWISLVPREEQEEAAEPRGVLPDETQSAAPGGSLRFGHAGKEKKEIPSRENPLFNALDALVRAITGTPRQEPALPRDTRSGHGLRSKYGAGDATLPGPKPRVLPRLIRLLITGACLALIYHVFARKGWVPRLF